MSNNCLPSLTIVSPLQTIDVKYNAILNRRELERVCCDDVKVWVTWQDTCPWFLNDKLVTTSPIKKRVLNQWWCEQLDIWLDTSLLVDKDEKVAIDSDCPAVYLSQALDVSDTEYFEWDKVSCKMQLKITPKCLLHEDLQMDNEFSITLDDDKVWYITLPHTAYSRSIFATPTSICPSSTEIVQINTLVDLYPWDEDWGNNATPWVKNRFAPTLAVKTLEDWKYIINAGSVIWTWQWIATMRAFVAVILPSWDNYLIEEQVYEWPRYVDMDNDNVINSANDLINYADWLNPPSDWSEMQWSMTRSHPRLAYNTSRTVYLPAWSLIYKVWKYSTNTAEDGSRDVLELVFKRSWTAWTLSDESWWWNYLSVAQIPFKRLTD